MKRIFLTWLGRFARGYARLQRGMRCTRKTCSYTVVIVWPEGLPYLTTKCRKNKKLKKKWLLTALAQTLLKLVTLGQRSRSQWRNTYPFFLHNSLLTSILCISALLCTLKLKFGMSLRYTLDRFVVKFHKNRIVDDFIVTSFKSSPNNYPYLKFY